jgi:DNA-binding NarL/FixJ family response regulator
MSHRGRYEKSAGEAAMDDGHPGTAADPPTAGALTRSTPEQDARAVADTPELAAELAATLAAALASARWRARGVRPGDARETLELLQAARAYCAARGAHGADPLGRALLLPSRTLPACETSAVLTQRELEVLRLLAIGRSNRDIGLALEISPHTVANHVRSILHKTYTANRMEAAAYARRQGWLPS